jgi:hypothetical protein
MEEVLPDGDKVIIAPGTNFLPYLPLGSRPQQDGR